MGNFCARRVIHHHVHVHQRIHEVEAHDEQDPWIVIPNPATPRNVRFQRVVRRAIKLLRLRLIWSKAGSWLNTHAARNPQNHRIRVVMSYIFTHFPRTVLRNTKTMFDHLQRRRGALTYR